MVVAAATAHVWVAAIAGAVVETIPAVDKGGSSGAATGWLRFEVLGKRQRGEVCTTCSGIFETVYGGVATVSCHAECVMRIRVQTCHRVGSVSIGDSVDSPSGIGIGLVGNIPQILIASRSPANIGRVRIDFEHCHIGSYAGGCGVACLEEADVVLHTGIELSGARG